MWSLKLMEMLHIINIYTIYMTCRAMKEEMMKRI